MDDLKNLILGLKDDIKINTDKVSSVETVTNKLASDFHVINEKCTKLEEQNSVHEQKLTALEKELDYMRNGERENNILIFKMKDTSKENKNLLHTVLTVFLQAEVNITENQIENVKRIGRNEGSRPVLVTLTAARYKQIIFAKAMNISKLGYAISNDLPKEQRESQK